MHDDTFVSSDRADLSIAGHPLEGPHMPTWRERVQALAAAQDAVILAHNYQAPQIQDIADHVGDSLALSRIAATSSASTIVFCGVHFMAETAKILSPDKRVLLPVAAAGCSLADTINAGDVRSWKEAHPDGAVVAYVNTTAEVKAESTICCTSSNAVEVVRSIPEDREILFLPDQFLGAHVRRLTGRDNISVWLGECHVHAGISPQDVVDQVEADPAADLLIHPECGCATPTLWLSGTGDIEPDRVHILSTGGMLDYAKTTTATRVLVATETGMLHQLRSANPRTTFDAVNPRAVCEFMKMTTPDALELSLETGITEIDVDPEIAGRARAAVEGMIAIGTPSSHGE